MNPEQNNLNQTVTGVQPQVIPVAQPMPGVQPQAVPVAQPMPGVQPQAIPVAQPMPGAQPQVIPVVDPTQQQIPQLPTTPTIPISSDEDELIKAYIGPNYDKLLNSKFNVGAFLVTPLYLCYRKLFLYGFLLFIINLVIINFTNFSMATTAISVVIAIVFNKIYIPEVRKRVQKIKQKNPDKSLTELKEICAKKGGTSFGLAALGCFLNLIIAIVLLIILMVLGVATLFGELAEIELNENKETTEKENTNTTFNGMLSYDTSVNMADKFTITIPAEYTNNSESYSYEYLYNVGTEMFNDCEISLKVVNGYTSGETLINQMQTYHSKNTTDITDVNQINKNEISWNSYNLSDTFGKTHYYGTTKDNKAYLLSFSFDKNTNNVCEAHVEQVLNSIQSN